MNSSTRVPGRGQRHLYLSPHSDDAALSCGGLIYDQTQRGATALVVTFFAATPPPMAFSDFAQGQHTKWETERDAMAERRTEDRAALDVLGAEPLYLDYLDCIYRLHPVTGEAMYASEEGIFGAVYPTEADFPTELAAKIATLAGPATEALTLYAPLTVGHHVDHQLVQQAALDLASQGYRVWFYEDYPYAGKPGWVESALAGWQGPPLSVHIVPISEAAMTARVNAIACYRSQIRTLFGDLETMERQTRAYCAALLASATVQGFPEGEAPVPPMHGEAGGYAERYWLLSGAQPAS